MADGTQLKTASQHTRGQMQNPIHGRWLKVVAGASIVIGIALLGLGLVLSPDFVGRHVSADGILAAPTIVKVWMLRLLTGLCGLLLVGYGGLKLIAEDIAARLDGILKEMLLVHLRRPRGVIVLVFLLLALFSINRAINLAAGDKWKSVIGYEYYWIAESLASGHGYSLAANHRWYFYDFKSEYPGDEYYPTALEEPMYPALLALSFTSLGAYGKLFVLLLQVAALYVTSLMIYLLVKKVFNSRLGILFSVVLLLRWPETFYLSERVFSPAVFAGLSMCLSAYVMLWSLEKISFPRALVTGCVLGCNCLLLADSLLFVPLAVLLTILLKRPLKPLAWRPALAIAVAAAIVLTPWLVRIGVVFGELIPVRTGFGLILHQSNVAMAGTFTKGKVACHESLEPIWQAKDATEAIEAIRNTDWKRMAIYKRGYDCVALEAPPGYAAFNEPQRDKVYLEKSLEFMAANPGLFLKMTGARILVYLKGWESRHAVISVLAFIGALISWRNYRSLIIVLLAAGFSFPFALVGSWMYRYRYPVEPMMFVLASSVLVFMVGKAGAILNSRRLMNS